ncbi:hypothetical protein B4064_2325 [Caldibacillus thermoamylovorans]|nr:hypothetical protein B4065_3110 [Caldibacillus thermoamylovorans]KIO66137.1 hypothetical protein B4064_2325 [Caldibacillus thermoamylovorans]
MLLIEIFMPGVFTFIACPETIKKLPDHLFSGSFYKRKR